MFFACVPQLLEVLRSKALALLKKKKTAETQEASRNLKKNTHLSKKHSSKSAALPLWEGTAIYEHTRLAVGPAGAAASWRNLDGVKSQGSLLIYEKTSREL